MDFYFIFLALISVVASEDAKSRYCGEGLEWDPSEGTCRSCSTGTVYNKYTRKCLIITNKESKCDKGFKFDFVEDKCVDIDECNQNTFPCKASEYCVNENGNYKCKSKNFCGQGYRFDVTNQKCKDIDECLSTEDNCGRNMICVNVPGSFTCRIPCPKNKTHYWNGGCHVCEEGFRLNRKTLLCEDVDECAGPYKLSCSPFIEKCVKMPGLSKCVPHCSGGTTVVDGICYDIDECEARTHNCTSDKKCENLFGTFQCENPNCNLNAIFDTDTNSCTCKKGYKASQYTGECTDENECLASPAPCGTFGRCVNTDGNFSCICNEGYHQVNGTCEDINECETMKGVCGSLTCNNLPGNYTCMCPPGFRIKEYDVCEDIDECADSPDLCKASNILFGETYHCFNLIGSFKCLKSRCPSDYRTVTEDGLSRCELVNADCSLEHNKACVQTLPHTIFQHVVQISRLPHVPYKFAAVSLQLADYDDFRLRIVVKKAVDTSTGVALDTYNIVTVTYDRQSDKVSFHLMRPLGAASEIIFDVFLKYSDQSRQQIKSLHQFHIFANDDSL